MSPKSSKIFRKKGDKKFGDKREKGVPLQHFRQENGP